jgi:hypothetical protein
MRKFLSLTRRLVTLLKVNTICLVEYEQQYPSLILTIPLIVVKGAMQLGIRPK